MDTLNFKKAIIDPENVIAPTEAPIDISTKPANFIFPTAPKLKEPDLKMRLVTTPQLNRPNYESPQINLASQS